MNIKFVNVTQSCLVAVYRNFWAAYRSYCSLKKGPVSCPATPENKETLADSDRQTDRRTLRDNPERRRPCSYSYYYISKTQQNAAIKTQ